MERKTKINAEDGKQELMIIREFDLPLELLFKAYAEPEIVGQWMGTKVLKLESKKHGSYQFETTDAQGNVVFRANGVIHEFNPNQKIIRTFVINIQLTKQNSALVLHHRLVNYFPAITYTTSLCL